MKYAVNVDIGVTVKGSPITHPHGAIVDVSDADVLSLAIAHKDATAAAPITAKSVADAVKHGWIVPPPQPPVPFNAPHPVPPEKE